MFSGSVLLMEGLIADADTFISRQSHPIPLILACSSGFLEHVEAPHSQAEEEQLSSTRVGSAHIIWTAAAMRS